MSEKERLLKLKNKFIIYKDKLNIPSNVTFGIEIEYENLELDKFSYFLENEKKYKTVTKELEI